MIDWTNVIIAFIAGLPATIAAVAAFVASLRNARKLAENTALTEKAVTTAAAVKTELAVHDQKRDSQMMVLEAKVEEVHKATNSLTDRLVESTEVEAHARGVLEGKATRNPLPPTTPFDAH